MSKKINLTVTTPHGTFSRKTESAYTHVCLSVPASRTEIDGDGKCVERVFASPADFVAAYPGKGGVFGRYVKDGGYVVSWHMSEATARRAFEKGNSAYVTTRSLGVYPVDAK